MGFWRKLGARTLAACGLGRTSGPSSRSTIRRHALPKLPRLLLASRSSRLKRRLWDGFEPMESRRLMAVDSRLFAIQLGDFLTSDGLSGSRNGPAGMAPIGLTPEGLGAFVSGAGWNLDESHLEVILGIADVAKTRLGLDLADLADAEFSATAPVVDAELADGIHGDIAANLEPTYTLAWRGMEWDFHRVDGAMDFVPLEQYGFHNPNAPIDIDNDGFLAPIDALLVVNHLNSLPSTFLPNRAPASMAGMMLDVTGDRWVSPQDALLVINGLNSDSAGFVGRRLVAQDDFAGQVMQRDATNLLPTFVDVRSNDFFAGNVQGVWHLTDASRVKVVTVGQPTSGTAEIITDPGSPWNTYVLYTPGDLFSGQDSFTYTIADAAGNRAEAVVYISYHPELPPINYLSFEVPSELTASAPGASVVFADEAGQGLLSVVSSGDLPAAVSVLIDWHHPQFPGMSLAGTLTSDVVATSATLTPLAAGGVWITGEFEQVNAILAGLRFDPAPGFSAPEGLNFSLYATSGHTDNVVSIGGYATFPLYLPGIEGSPATVRDTATIDDFIVPMRLDVLANDSSPTGSPLRLVSVASSPTKIGAVAETVFGTVRIDTEANVVVYTPSSVFYGDDSFAYVVADAEGRLSQGFAVVSAYGYFEPRRIQANNDQVFASYPAGTTSFPAVDIDVLANDFPGDTLFTGVWEGTGGEDPIVGGRSSSSDPSHYQLRIGSVGIPSHGTAEIIDGDASIGRPFVRYTPNADFPGSDSFTYVIEDAVGNRSEAFVFVSLSIERGLSENITIVAPTVVSLPAPSSGFDFVDDDGAGLIAIQYAGEATSDVRVSLDLQFNSPFGFAVPGTLTSSTADSETFSRLGFGNAVLVSGTLEQVNAVLAGLRYEPTPGFSAPDGLLMYIYAEVFHSEDSTPEGNVKFLTINVPSDSSAPVTVPDTIELPASGGPLRIDVLANDSSPVGSSLRIVDVITLSSWIEVPPDYTPPRAELDIETNEIVYYPTADMWGADIFVYVVSDVDGRLSHGYVSLYNPSEH